MAAALQLADLGVERRDVLSTATDERRGRAVPQYEAVDVLNREEARRARAREGGNGSEVADRLAAWNNSATFAPDNVAEMLQNRFDGQGHRAALQESLEGRVRRSTNSTSGAAHGPPLPPRQRRLPRNYTHAAQSGPPRQRAPSPRASGTVRFGPGRQRLARATSEAQDPRTIPAPFEDSPAAPLTRFVTDPPVAPNAESNVIYTAHLANGSRPSVDAQRPRTPTARPATTASSTQRSLERAPPPPSPAVLKAPERHKLMQSKLKVQYYAGAGADEADAWLATNPDLASDLKQECREVAERLVEVVHQGPEAIRKYLKDCQPHEKLVDVAVEVAAGRSVEISNPTIKAMVEANAKAAKFDVGSAVEGDAAVEETNSGPANTGEQSVGRVAADEATQGHAESTHSPDSVQDSAVVVSSPSVSTSASTVPQPGPHDTLATTSCDARGKRTSSRPIKDTGPRRGNLDVISMVHDLTPLEIADVMSVLSDRLRERSQAKAAVN